MSSNLIADIAEMHAKFGVNTAVAGFANDKEKLRAFLEFRAKFIGEEYTELLTAIGENDADGVVDAFIDLVVVAIGSLDALNIDAHTAWDRVLVANMSKSPGSNPTRPNAFGLPDMVKPANFEAPDHTDNIGYLSNIM